MIGKKFLPHMTALFALVASSAVLADGSDVFFELIASGNGETGTFQVTRDQGVIDPETGNWTWAVPSGGIAIMSQAGGMVAELQEGSLSYSDSPNRVSGMQQVNMSVSVLAGSVDTDFVIKSANVTFAPVPNAQGRADAQFGVTDLSGNALGQVTGLNPNGDAFRAQYNGFVPSGLEFSSLIPSVLTTVPFGTANAFENDPDPVNFRPVGDTVSEISSIVEFRLTAGDLATATTNFEIVPEPASLALLALGALAALRRR